MKYIFQTPIFLLMLWASGVSYATHSVALIDGKIDAYVKNACSPSDASGAIDLVITGGIGPYDVIYLDDNGETVHTASVNEAANIENNGDEDKKDLPSGLYTVMVTDHTCALATMVVEIGVNEPIVIDANPEAICQEGTGQINPIVTGGQGGYTFAWSNGATSQNINNLSEGTFTVTVTDEAGCTKSQQFQITKQNLIITGPQNSYLCRLEDEAVITVDVSNGIAPFMFSWSSGETVPTITTTEEGNYTVTVTDAMGCNGVRTFKVERNVQIKPIGQPGFTQIEHTCNSQNSGKIIIQTNSTGVTYLWTKDGQNFQSNPIIRNIQNLGTGLYCVTVTDGWSCQDAECYEIKNEEIIETNPVESPGCNSNRNYGNIGIIEPLPFFEDPEIQKHSTYKWSHNASLATSYANFLSSGIYTVTITNNVAKACKVRVYTYELENQIPLNAIGVVTNGVEGGITPVNSKIEITTIGGSGMFKYEWKKLNNSNIISKEKDLKNIESGIYILKIRDDETGCLKELSFVMNNKKCENGILPFGLSRGFLFTPLLPETVYDSKNCANASSVKIFANYYTLFIKEPNEVLLPLTVECIGMNGIYLKRIVSTKEELHEMKPSTKNEWEWIDDGSKINFVVPRDDRGYDVIFTDVCGRNMTTHIDVCEPCREPELDSRDDDRHVYEFPLGLKLHINKPCGKNNGTIEVHKWLNQFINIKYTITWPDGSQYIIERDGNKKLKENSKSKRKFKPSNYSIPQIVKIDRADGCSYSISITFTPEVDNVLLSSSPLSNSAYWGTNAICSGCIPNGSAGYFYEACPGEKSSLKKFDYKPDDITRPCEGGTFTASILVNGTVKTQEWYASGTALVGHNRNIDDVRSYLNNPICIVGGGCLFDPLYLDYYTNLNGKPIYLPYCQIEQDAVFDEGPPLEIECPKYDLKVVNGVLEFEYIGGVNFNGIYFELVISSPTGSTIKTKLTMNGAKPKKLFFDTKGIGGEYRFYIKGLEGCDDFNKTIEVKSGEKDCPSFYKQPKYNSTSNQISFSLKSPKYFSTFKVKLIRLPSTVVSLNSNPFPSDITIGYTNNYSISNTDLSEGKYKIIISVNDCDDFESDFLTVGPNFKEDEDCGKSLKSIAFDDDKFIIYSESQSSLSVFSFEKTYHNSFFNLNNIINKVNLENIQFIRKDSLGSSYVFCTDNINQFVKLDIGNNILWTLPLSGFFVKSISDGNTGTYELIGIDEASQKWLSKTISSDGVVVEEKTLPIESPNFDLVHQSGNTTIAYHQEAGSITFAAENGTLVKEVPSGVTIKDIKTLENNNILMAGEFNGSVTAANTGHDSEGYKNAIFLTYDHSGNLLSSKSIQKYRDETVNGIATKGNTEVAYHGRYEEIVTYAIDPDDNVIDSCNFIDIIKLEDPCTTFTSTLTYDVHQCQLSWDEAPTGYTTMVQMEINGVWMPVQKAVGVDVAIVSPYTIIRDGKYRLVSSKDGCPDILSNEVNTSCTSGCACSIPNLGYDQTACTLTWTLTGCVGYTPSLQKLNSNNEWETIVQQASSPFNIITNGSYRLSVSKGMNTIGNACPTVLSNTVATACTPSSNACSCAPATLSHNTASCSLSWTASSCTGYTTALQRNIAGVWTTINASSPYTIPTNSNGSYRIVRSKSGCTDLLSNVVNVTCSCSSPASITIFDYGTSGLGQNATILKGQSYTHEVSQGSPDACDESFIQLAFASSVVNISWTFYVNGSVAVMPGTVIGSQYVVDLYLPTPPSGGTADVFMQSPCGDFYQLHLVYDCEPECVYIPCQSFFIDEFNLTNILLIENGNIAHNVSGYWNAADGCDHPNMTALSNQIKSSIISSYPSCDNASFNVFITWINDGFVIVLENSPMDIIQINANNFPPAFDTGICYPLNCECPAINISISGSINNSCENLTLNVTGGSAPYTYQISGTGSQGTNINQNGSSNVINLSGLLIGETITLSVTVTDQNGCTGDESITYLRCASGCSGNTCSSQPAVCNVELNSSSGYNQDAIINFIVPSGVSQIFVELAPQLTPQSLNVLKNGQPCGINVQNITFAYPPLPTSDCFTSSININGFNQGEEMYTGGFRNSVYASHPLSVTAGDILVIDINHPQYCIASNWNFRIVCSGTGSKPVRNTFELENQVELEEKGVNGLSHIAKEERKSFRFYPNPFSKGINLELTSVITESLQLEVFNNLGLQVFTKTIDVQQGINLRYIEEFENVPSGVYTVKIKSDTKDHTSRVIKVE